MNDILRRSAFHDYGVPITNTYYLCHSSELAWASVWPDTVKGFYNVKIFEYVPNALGGSTVRQRR